MRQQGLTAKHALMRMRRLVYPDVYSLPYFLVDRFDFIRDGTRIRRGEYDLILTELNRTAPQLRYIERVLGSGVAPVAVIPGPPELLASVLDGERLRLVKSILGRARWVWAYSRSVQAFANGLAGAERAQRIPWPFDLGATRVLAGRRASTRPEAETVRILLTVPLRFGGLSQNYPFVLKSALEEGLAGLSPERRDQLTFHTFVYTKEDAQRFHSSGFAAGLPVRLEAKRGFRGFVRFLASCDAVVNLTTGGILGRITFLAAALGKPGLFSDNSDINPLLYPDASLGCLDTPGIHTAVRELLEGVLEGTPPARFRPDAEATAALGDFAANRERFRAIVQAGLEE
jgi:hypothetical protein